MTFKKMAAMIAAVIVIGIFAVYYQIKRSPVNNQNDSKVTESASPDSSASSDTDGTADTDQSGDDNTYSQATTWLQGRDDTSAPYADTQVEYTQLMEKLYIDQTGTGDQPLEDLYTDIYESDHNNDDYLTIKAAFERGYASNNKFKVEDLWHTDDYGAQSMLGYRIVDEDRVAEASKQYKKTMDEMKKRVAERDAKANQDSSDNN